MRRQAIPLSSLSERAMLEGDTNNARRSSEQGMWPMRSVALERVASGETTLQEVDRILGEMPVEDPAITGRSSGAVDLSLVNGRNPEVPYFRERRSMGDRRRGPRRAD